MFTILVVPAITNQAGQCRVVAREGNFASNALDNYRTSTGNAWREVGLMNSLGCLAYFAGPREVREDIEDCQPLCGGWVYTTEIKPWPSQS